jgi:hypothetical protein
MKKQLPQISSAQHADDIENMPYAFSVDLNASRSEDREELRQTSRLSK